MISFPYTSVKTMSGNTPQYDRAVNSKTKRLYNKLRYKQGIAPDSGKAFKVVPDTGMKVKVLCDGAWTHIGGNFGYEEAKERSLTVQDADSSYDRIDNVVLRNDISSSVRAIDLYIVRGVPAISPVAPALTNTPEIQEKCIAQLFIRRGSTTISADRITDTRLDPELCGVLTNAFGNVDTKPFFTQLEQMIKNLAKEIESVKDGSAYMLKTVYDKTGSGVVDNSEKLGGQLPAYYAKKSDLDNTQRAVSNAQTAASNAQSTANSAKTAASNAQNTADTAKSNAATAQNTANSAKSTADSALNKANASIPKSGAEIPGLLGNVNGTNVQGRWFRNITVVNSGWVNVNSQWITLVRK